MQRLAVLLALVASGCPDDKSGSTTDADTTAVTGTTIGTTGSAITTSGTTGSLPEGACRTANDCDDSETCTWPGTVQCGGATGCALNGEACVDDPSCGGTPESPQICVQDPCCGMGVCRPGCLTDMECGLAQRCGDDARCTAASCDLQNPCPANYGCAANICGPVACTGDAECDDYCVFGFCSAVLGICVSLAP